MSSAGVNISAALSGFGRLIAAVNPPLQIGQQASQDAVDDNLGPWSPPQWGSPALTILSVPPPSRVTAVTTTILDGGGNVLNRETAVLPGDPDGDSTYVGNVNYVFDAVLRTFHTSTVRTTQHPVLNGTTISDHAVVEPRTITLEIGMSDAMGAFANGMWTQAGTKSQSAFQVLRDLQATTRLVTLQTRLQTYQNMLIVSITTPDDVRTLHGLRATVTLRELIAGAVQTVPASSRPHETQKTNRGVVQSQAVDPALLSQHVVPDQLMATYPTVPGSGNITSNSVSSLPGAANTAGDNQ